MQESARSFDESGKAKMLNLEDAAVVTIRTIAEEVLARHGVALVQNEPRVSFDHIMDLTGLRFYVDATYEHASRMNSEVAHEIVTRPGEIHLLPVTTGFVGNRSENALVSA